MNWAPSILLHIFFCIECALFTYWIDATYSAVVKCIIIYFVSVTLAHLFVKRFIWN